MTPKAERPAPPPQQLVISGKWLIVGIVAVALVAAGTSWLVRYNATHRAARFWGPDAAKLIRDAPEVTLFKQPTVPTDSLGVDTANASAVVAAFQEHINKSAITVSNAPGLLHLRNALLDDASFIWPIREETWPIPGDDIHYWWLSFSDPASGKTAMIWFAKDCRQALRNSPKGNGTFEGTAISTEPIANGLREMFAEMSASQ